MAATKSGIPEGESQLEILSVASKCVLSSMVFSRQSDFLCEDSGLQEKVLQETKAKITELSLDTEVA